MPKIFAAFIMCLALTCSSGLALAQNAENAASPFDNVKWADAIKQKGVLKVGFDTFVPWAMKDKNGKFIGFEIEVAEALAKDLGVEVQFVPTAWNGIIPALLTGKFDILIGGMGITPERAEKVAFTDPYEFSGVALTASLTAAPGLTKAEDFNKKDMKIAVRMGTTAATAAKNLFPEAEILPFGDEGQAIQELMNGRAGAFVSGAPLPAQLAAKNPESVYIPVSGVLTKEPIGMALAPANKDALPALNAWIKSRTEQGWFESRWKYWFETMDWEKDLK